jgi:hypothetical protein
VHSVSDVGELQRVVCRLVGMLVPLRVGHENDRVRVDLPNCWDDGIGVGLDCSPVCTLGLFQIW